MIQTVRGKIKKEELGVCAAHEHLIIDLSKIKKDPDTILDNEEEAAAELKRFFQAGGRSLVELTNDGMGRDVLRLKKLSELTNIHIITCTGFYKEPFIPEFAKGWDRDRFAHHFITEIRNGVNGVFPGVIGEVGTSLNQITPLEKELLLGAGQAALETGLTVSTHTTLGTMGIRQVELLFGLGLPKEQIVIGHQDLNPNKEEVLEVLSSGVYIGFDTIGKNNYRPDEARMEFLLDFIERGYHKQILLSCDLTRKSHWKMNGGIGYDYALSQFIPALKERGVTDDIIEDLLVHNPANAFSIKEPVS
ncbi:MAG: phosphotriesterase [Caldibacillus debilis]|uniref:Phosphotriesterase n=2 Tax=Caldibacillus debilis TaxID=301148 RepID=A0A3E0JY31_9BACI|nr:phosphotriesterase [Caldibacillus debilis]REJ18620.1 MAG: phosphotriesterase [Caldibacillus debilis]REJ24753.1 MAG: phosphotriesterase [Caldibacillus debilis]REJ26226.1 MAG: phosphotriesterase [Caldibacillus debilis]RKO62555.1 putative metal-dependent hydrolase with the TIM-barrel fold [Caldibacillus debilis GB1]